MNWQKDTSYTSFMFKVPSKEAVFIMKPLQPESLELAEFTFFLIFDISSKGYRGYFPCG